MLLSSWNTVKLLKKKQFSPQLSGCFTVNIFRTHLSHSQFLQIFISILDYAGGEEKIFSSSNAT